jgi:hypothetical protein
MTAVEWLVNQLKEGIVFNEIEVIEKAKEMELDRLQDAYSMGRLGGTIKEFNETFKSE